MSVFVDTGVFFAHHDTDAEHHDQAVSAFDELFDGEFGQPYTNDYVFDDTRTTNSASLMRRSSLSVSHAVSTPC
jgi:hypothetical protein